VAWKVKDDNDGIGKGGGTRGRKLQWCGMREQCVAMLMLKFSRQPTEENLDGLKPGVNLWQPTKRRTRKMLKKLMAKMQNEEGQGLVEYALIIVLVSIACIVALSILGVSVSNVFSQITTSI
jgi:pilus assembly protein Flp/PilA